MQTPLSALCGESLATPDPLCDQKVLIPGEGGALFWAVILLIGKHLSQRKVAKKRSPNSGGKSASIRYTTRQDPSNPTRFEKVWEFRREDLPVP